MQARAAFIPAVFAVIGRWVRVPSGRALVLRPYGRVPLGTARECVAAADEDSRFRPGSIVVRAKRQFWPGRGASAHTPAEVDRNVGKPPGRTVIEDGVVSRRRRAR